jgi:hypothetical protein
MLHALLVLSCASRLDRPQVLLAPAGPADRHVPLTDWVKQKLSVHSNNFDSFIEFEAVHRCSRQRILPREYLFFTIARRADDHALGAHRCTRCLRHRPSRPSNRR